MIFSPNRSEYKFFLGIALLSFGLFNSCTTIETDIRDELVRSLKGANLEGFYFATEEDETRVVASLTNKIVRDFVNLDYGSTNQILRYAIVKSKETKTTTTYKTEIVKLGNSLELMVTDIATGEIVNKMSFPVPEPHKKTDTNGSEQIFDSLDDCVEDFECKSGGALQCEANRTCKDQFAHLTCCLEDGQCLALVLIIKPTTLKCKLSAVIPDFEGLVLSQ